MGLVCRYFPEIRVSAQGKAELSGSLASVHSFFQHFFQYAWEALTSRYDNL